MWLNNVKDIKTTRPNHLMPHEMLIHCWPPDESHSNHLPQSCVFDLASCGTLKELADDDTFDGILFVVSQVSSPITFIGLK